MIEAVVFDLDDTLIFERDYVRSGFLHVARNVANADVASDDAFAFLWDAFSRGERGDLFDRLLAYFPSLADTHSVPQLVDQYRTHAPDLSFAPGMHSIIKDLDGTAKLALISDGPLVSQQAKVNALNLDAHIPLRILTDRWGRDYWKPHHRAFHTVASQLACPPEELLFVADNPTKDFITPKRLGWQTIRLRLPAQLRYEESAPSYAYSAARDVHSVQELRNALAGLLLPRND